MRRLFSLSLFTVAAVCTTAAMADDWVAVKLRGNVLAQQDGQWVHLVRGDVVADSRTIRTMADGVVEFTRDGETIDVLGNTQLQIHDRSGQRFTTVEEVAGEVAITANVENVKHFAVDTPFMVAVVKGTKFTVTSDSAGTQVDVTRGKVGVEDLVDHTFVDVLVGQHASGGDGHPLTVTGTGVLQPITNAKGKVVSVVAASGAVVTDTSSMSTSSGKNGSAQSGSDNGKGNGGVPGNGGNKGGSASDSSGTSGSDGNSGKSDNGNGNGGVPGNGKGNSKNGDQKSGGAT